MTPSPHLSRREGRPIRLRAAAPLIAALALSACGTWNPATDPGPDATRTTPIEGGSAAGGQADLTVGDGTFQFELTDCFLSADDGVRFTGGGENGERITGEYDPEDPESTFITVTDQEGNVLYTADGESDVAPGFEMTEDGFTATGAFTTGTEERIDGSVSGAC